MKVMFCWRCQMDIPMLDEDEFKLIRQLYSSAFQSREGFSREHNLPLEQCSIKDRFLPMLQKY